MRRELMEFVACPLCKGDLELEVGEEDAATGEVLSGTLRCGSCDRLFEIQDGIPDLRPPEESG